MATNVVVDFREYGLDVQDISNVEEKSIKSLGKQIISNFKTYGFSFLKNHGVAESMLDEYFKVSRDFFEQPVEFKEKYPIGSDYIFGWMKLEREKLNQDRSAGDLHEAFNFVPGILHSYIWPPVEKFESSTKRMQETGTELALRFCDVLSLGLDLPIDFMRNAHSKKFLQVRTSYYPVIPSDRKVAADQARIGEHIDWGTVTFHFQDAVGGLEVRNPNGVFVPIDPLPGAVLVTPSALLQRWTSDVIKAAVHRILLDDETREKTRQAIILYLQPDSDFEIKCLDGSKKYEPITSEEYWKSEAKHSLRY